MAERSMTTSSIVGRRAPEFEVPCTTTPTHPEPIARLRDYQDRWLILMFYPQDFSLVCPTELSAGTPVMSRCGRIIAIPIV